MSEKLSLGRRILSQVVEAGAQKKTAGTRVVSEANHVDMSAAKYLKLQQKLTRRELNLFLAEVSLLRVVL